MNFRKNSTLIIGMGASVILLGIALYFLFVNRSSFNEIKNALVTAENRLVSLNNRNPYPSPENVALTKAQLEMVGTNYITFTEILREGQLAASTMEPAQFALLLEETVRHIREKAMAGGVALPVEPGLGFKDYAAGKLPSNDPAVIERLVFQVKALENVISLLIDSKVISIDALQRDQFEVAMVPVANAESGGRGQRGMQSGRDNISELQSPAGGIPASTKSDLYSTERLTIEFTGRESAVWDALTRLGSSKVTYVVVDLNVTSTATSLGQPVDLKSKLSTMAAAVRNTTVPVTPAMGAVPQLSLDSISREERVVGGREPIKVRMVVDVYRFKEAIGGEVTP